MIKVCIQVETGSQDKNIYDEKTLTYKETRQVSQPYPYPYGFIIGTSAIDGDCEDCYIITHKNLEAGKIVDCEPIALLEQFEGEEIDHKVLATMPGQEVALDEKLLKELQDFIYAIFAAYPDININVGHILPLEAALSYIQAGRKSDHTS